MAAAPQSPMEAITDLLPVFARLDPRDQYDVLASQSDANVRLKRSIEPQLASLFEPHEEE